MEAKRLDEPGLSEIQRRVEEIWRDVLRMPADQANATFFELGGQSISAMRITSKIEEEFGVSIDLGELFEDPDLHTFARNIAAKAARISETSVS